MKTSDTSSELARQLRSWAQSERHQEGREDLLRLADEYERAAAPTAESSRSRELAA